MSALSSSSALVRRVALFAALTCIPAIVAGGCAAPGASRLAGTPDGMPPSLAYVPGDSLGWIVADTDPKRTQSVALRRSLGTDADVADGIVGSVLGEDTASKRPAWLGSVAGVAMYTLRSGEAARLTFVDIDDRGAAERALRDSGWKERSGDGVDTGAEDDLTLWTREPGDVEADAPLALGLANDGLVAAATKPELHELAAHTRRYDATERPATVEYTIDALRAAPVAVVYRSDAIRADLRTLVRDDAALVELTRWFFQTSSVYALRDGWIGMVAAGGKLRDTDVRIVGRMDWARAATDVPEPRPVPRSVVDRVPANARFVFAFDDPGAYLGDLLGAITDGGGEFTTELDATEGTPKLEPLLDRLDGGASVTLWDELGGVAVATSEPDELAKDLGAAFTRLRIADRATVRAEGAGTVVVRVQLDGAARAVVDGFVGRNPVDPDVTGNTLGNEPSVAAAFRAAGKPPTTPVGWVYAAASPCDRSRPIAGWITWDTKTQRLAWSIDVPVVRDDRAAARCSFSGALDRD